MRRFAVILSVAAALVFPVTALGQYYDWGASPASIRWSRIATPEVKVLAPSECGTLARRTLFFADTVRRSVAFGYRYGTMPTPVVLHTRNFRSNGIVMWAPRRVELITVPEPQTYAVPWIKHLVAHEFRHNVQYNNLNKHFIKVLSWLLGDQGSLLGLAFLPVWALEGDAVAAETQMTAYGRGKQPSFNMEYRAMGGLHGRKWQVDRWFCGSYKVNVPDHYKLGYQMCAWSYDRFGRIVWDDVADYASRYPFTILPKYIVLRRCYGTSVGRMFRGTFDSLESFWASLPRVENSMRRVATPETSYTTYRYPIVESDTTVLALKSDLDRTSRLVRVHTPSGREEVLAMTGNVSSRPVLRGRSMMWTEYRADAFYPERVFSQLVSMDLDRPVPRRVRGFDRVLYPVALPGGRTACVEYDYTGRYAIVCDTMRVEDPEASSIHGLAYDDLTRKLCYIGLCDEGMYLAEADLAGGGVRRLTRPSYSSLSSLRAGGGYLYFGSIASGRDEVNMLCLTSLKQWRVTSSEFGSFDPGPEAFDPDTPEVRPQVCPEPGTDGAAAGPAARRIALTSYDRDGYHLALQEFAMDTLERVEWAQVPPDAVNPPHRKWEGVMNLDTVSFTPLQDSLLARRHPTGRFRKVPHLFKVHSWAPFDFNPYELTSSEVLINVHVGATVISQDLLSSMTAMASVGWARGSDNGRGASFYTKVQYNGLAPKLEFELNWGGYRQAVYRNGSDPVPAKRTSHFDMTGRIYLPLLMDCGYHYRYFTPMVEWTYINSLLYRGGVIDSGIEWNNVNGLLTPNSSTTYRQGVNKTVFSLQYTDQVRMARRDFLPRWAWTLRGYVAVEPTNGEFGSMLGFTGTLYTPGVLPHNSLRLRAAWQHAWRDKYNFRAKEVFPRGATYDFTARRYMALSADYQLPLCYPDWGIPSILYIKRIRLDAGFDYARYLPAGNSNRSWNGLWSAGGSIIFDLNVLRMPDSGTTTFKFSVFKPSDRAGSYISMGVSLPI